MKRTRVALSCVSAIALAAAIATPALAAPTCPTGANCPWLDTKKSPDARADALVAQMTLDEKALQLGNDAPAIPRLGIPAYNWWNEGLHGVARAGIATVFPQAIGMSAAWNPTLMRSVGDTIGTEFRAKYLERVHPDGSADWYRGLTVWSPNINIFRDPRWGRGQETYGEDPYLTGRTGIAFIEGLQGDDPRYFKTIATSKHFAVHSGPESTRHQADIHPTPHDLEDTYLPAFRATVTEAHVDSIMCSYNAINGVPGCANTMLMTQHLRHDWNFKGYVVSDCGAAANIYRPDALHYTRTAPEGVALAFKAGMDVICGDYRNHMTTEPDNIVAAVKQGLMSQATVDLAVHRLFVARIKLGLFDPQAIVFPGITAKDYDTPAHRDVALDMARQSMVLLKNDNHLLPLVKTPETIAVIGPNADSLDTLVGNYYGKPSHPVTVLDGIRARFPKAKILYSQGSGLVGREELAIPDDALCVDAACSAHGLAMDAFATHEITATPAHSDKVANARQAWSGEDKDTATRWTGFLTAPKSGEYSFRYASENGYRIWIGDTLVVDEWGVTDSPSIDAGRITLDAGKTYPIRVEAAQSGQTGRQQLVWSVPDDDGQDAVAMAKQADVVIFVGGLSARIEGEEMKLKADGFAGGDRTSLDLPAPQEQLLEKLQATGKPVVLVLENGSALSVNWAQKNVQAIVEAWYPGGQGGQAVAELLAGDFSPAGRLPVTFYQSASQLPAFDNYTMAGRTYRYFNGPVLYPFGYGLSYTDFTYSDAKVSTAKVKAGKPLKASVTVANTGSRDSDEVVELYVAKPGDSAHPVLAGFSRVHLKSGASQKVSFDLDARRLSQVDAAGKRHVEPGKYVLSLGGGQPAYTKTATASLTVTGRADVPK